MSSYAQAAWGLAGELAESLSSEDAIALCNDLRAMGESAWLVWSDENHADGLEYLRATPAKRGKLKRWQDPQLRRRITLLAHRQAHLGALVLSELEWLGRGGSWRNETAYAADGLKRVLEQYRWEWPFDGERPFASWAYPDQSYVRATAVPQADGTTVHHIERYDPLPSRPDKKPGNGLDSKDVS